DRRRPSEGERIDVVELELVPGVAPPPAWSDVRAGAGISCPDLPADRHRRKVWRRCGLRWFHAGTDRLRFGRAALLLRALLQRDLNALEQHVLQAAARHLVAEGVFDLLQFRVELGAGREGDGYP